MDCGFISENCRGSLAKDPAEAVSSDVDRWITIPWPRAKRGSDLIYAVHTRSNGSEQKGGKSPAATIGCGGASLARRNGSNPALIRLRIGLGSFSAVLQDYLGDPA